MTNKQFQKVWLGVANLIETGKEGYLCCGFADAVGDTVAENFRIEDKMYNFSNGYRDGNLQLAWFMEHDKSREYRLMFACLFSNMTVKEFNAVCK